MAIGLIQISTLQKTLCAGLLLAVAAVLTACISPQPYPSGVAAGQPTPTPVVRAPKIGQEWVYNVRNVFNQQLVDVVTERVVSVGEQVRIQRSGEKAGPLPDEIQSPWGYVFQDARWTPPQRFIRPIPLWPTQFTAGFSQFYKANYQVLGYPDGTYYWGLGMQANQWEWVKVPAGEFLTLQYHNEMPYFESNDVFRVGNIRDEDIWFSPEIGRWVIRRGYGRYITNGIFWVKAYWEDYLQWELVSWK